VARVRGQVRSWANRILGDADEADDVAQLVLLRLHAHVDRFEARSQFSTWLFRVTRNVSLSHRLREQRRRELVAGHTGDDPAVHGADDDTLSEQIVALLHHFDQLPARQREVYELADLRGLQFYGDSGAPERDCVDRARIAHEGTTSHPTRDAPGQSELSARVRAMTCHEVLPLLLEADAAELDGTASTAVALHTRRAVAARCPVRR
jgi:RNA polymerase sigma factor (sigma-70 family)